MCRWFGIRLKMVTLHPKSSASANSATPAFVTSRVGYIVSRLDDNHFASSIVSLIFVQPSVRRLT